MEENVREQENCSLLMRKRRIFWRRLAAFLACIVVFCTTYALILPAITMEKTANCGIEEHQHSEDCYEKRLICGQAEGGTVPGHTHTESCYEYTKVLNCGQEESETHTHTEQCYTEEKTLICGEEERPETVAQVHTHTSECYEDVLTCTKEVHTHGPECYSDEEEGAGTVTLVASGEDYEVVVTCDENAGIPEDATLRVKEYAQGSEEYLTRFTEANDELLNQDGSCIHLARFFDISIMDGENEIEPKDKVKVEISQTSDLAEEQGDIVITHTTDEGTDVISEIEVSRGDNGDVTTSFETESFSDYGTISAGKSVTIGIGDTVTLQGASGNRNIWSTDPEECVTVTQSGSDAIIKGDAAGTVTITHTYTNKGLSESFTIIVTDEGGSGEDDSDSAELDTAGQGYTVTVKGNKSILTDDVELHVEDYTNVESDYQEYYDALIEDLEAETASTVGEDDFDFLHMYHIYLTKTGVNGEYIPDGNVNLQVTITYDTTPAGWPSGNGNLYVGHYKMINNTVSREGISDTDGDTYSSGIRQVRISGDSITFHIKSFSVFPVAALANGIGDTEVVIQPGSDGTYGADLAATAKNDWQIVSGGYSGNAGTDKTQSDDTLVRVQKNVVPTDIENEFLIYLSVDKKVSWEEIIQNSNLLVTTSGSYKTIGATYESIHGNYGEVSPIEGSGENEYTATVTLTRNGEVIQTITQKYYGTVPNCSNATGFLELTIDGVTTYVTASTSVNLHEDGSGTGGALTYTVPIESLESKFDFADFTVGYDSVKDVMGEYINYDSTFTPAGDYSSVPIYDSDTKELSWVPVQKSGLSPTYTTRTKTIGWYLNSVELVYRVKLDVTKSGFNSAAEYVTDNNTDFPYATNASTLLSYHWTGEAANARSTNFTSPEVRGLLYDVQFDKVDKNNTSEKLSGATFTLTDISGKTYEIQETNGTYRIENIPEGTYTLTETNPPSGYQAVSTDPGPWSIEVSYTNEPSVLTQDTDRPANMLFIGNNDSAAGTWQIVNEKKAVYVDIIKTDMSYSPLSGAVFCIYDTDPSVEGATPMEGCENLSSQEDGIIADNLELEDGKTYYLVEKRAPDGYNLPETNLALTVHLTENTPVSVTGGAGTARCTPEKQTVNAMEETVYVVQIPNSTGVELPSTGGSGTLPYTFGGAGLILLSGLMYGYSMRRKRERRKMQADIS